MVSCEQISSKGALNLRINQALILAGGLGKRLGERTKNCPKPMQLINGEPFLNNIIWNLKRHNIKNIILSIGYLSNNFKHYYKNGSKFGVNIQYIEEDKPAGTGGAIKKCKKILDEYFLLINGDTLFDINYHDLSFTFLENKIGNIALNHVNNVSRYGLIKTEGEKIISFNEKGKSHPGYINSGIGVFKKTIIDFIKGENSSLEKDVFQKLVKNNLLSARKYNSFFIDIGIPKTLEEAKNLIPKWRSKGALLLDRDGVINEDYGYVHSMSNFKWVDGAIETIKMANDLGILVIVVTNQSGIARGIYSENDFKDFTSQINEKLINYGAHIDKTYYCPHHPFDGVGEFKKNCNCRKPKTGLIDRAIGDWNLDTKKCFLIGDKESDIIASNSCNIKSYLFDNKVDNLLEIFRHNLEYLKNQKL
jgi:D-glycero-D-manno-heptose 1,7-bisphosphate phosphatase